MATSGKKEYVLKINGVSENITNVTKLEEVLARLDTTVQRVNQSNTSSNRATRERAAALTEEEKAEKKLLETLDRAVRARTDANRAQIDANQAAREAQRQAVLEQQAANATANSVEEMRARLSLLKNEWKGLDVGSQRFRELTAEISTLNDKIKEAEQSTGDFRRNVGNYPDAMAGLGKLTEGIDGASKSSMGFAQSLLATNQLMALFGDKSEENTKQAQQLQKIMALLSVVQGINNNLLKQGITTTGTSIVMEKVHTIQVRARAAAIALANKNTLAATIAQKAFNLVAKANPYILLATALVAVTTALVAYKSSADDATTTTDKYKSSIDGVTFASKEARDAHDDLARKIRDIQIDIDVATGKLSNYEAAIIRVKNAGKDAIDQINNDETDALDEINDKYTSLGHTLNWLYLQGNIFKGKGPSDYLQAQLDEQDKMFADFNERRRKQRDINTKEEERTLTQSAAEIKKRNEDVRNETLDGLKGTLAKIQTERLREEQAALDQNKVIIEANKTRSKEEQLALNDISAIHEKYDKRRAEAIKSSNKAASDASKAALEKQKTALEKERDLIRKGEDDKTSLIVNEFDRRRAEVDAKYLRQREDLQRQLDTDKTLTEKGREAIRNIIANIDDHIAADRDKIRKDELEKEKEAEAQRKEILDKRLADNDRRAANELAKLDTWLHAAEQKIGDVIVRSKSGFELIDVEATRANLSATNSMLDEYVAGIEKAREEITKTHNYTILNLKQGTPEYEEELLKYANAMLDLNDKIKVAQDTQEENTKRSTQLQLEYYKELFAKVGEIADGVSQAVSAVTDTLNMSLQIQIDDLNEQMEVINERFEEVQGLREESVKRIEQLEADLQAATGGTAVALKEQLQDEMHNRAELEREEARLQKEKEKREAEIAKKEKQMKRNDMISNIAQAIANTAQGVTKALSLIFPLNLAVASIVGAMGAVQVGIMTKQLTKLEDGGEIKGPSHANGGVPIAGTNYEVEGGEFVVNKRSYSANAGLIRFINDNEKAVTMADLIGVVPGDNTPVIITDTGQSSEDRIVEAINAIDFQPKVAVTDIIDVSDEVTTVRDLAGF